MRQLSDQEIESLERLPYLSDADFHSGWGAYPAKVSDVGVAVLASLKLPRLSNVALGHNDKITDQALESLATIRGLSVINLDTCPNITAAGVGQLAALKHLESLNLSDCENVDIGQLDLIGGFGALQRVWVDGCKGLDQGAIEAVQAARPMLVIHAEKPY